MIQSLSHGRVLFDSIPSTHDLYNKLKNYPDSLILTVTRRSAANINDVILKHIFTNHPLALVAADDESLLPVHKDMKLMITRNVIMFIGFVNLSIGQFVTVTAISSKTIIATHPNGNIINIFPMSSIINNIQTTKYPVLPGYATTIYKVHGQTLHKVILWLDTDSTPKGTAYVALSRVKSLTNLLFFIPL